MNLIFGNKGQLEFKDEKEYYVALGTFCNNKAFYISYEPNKKTGSYSDAYRMRKLNSAHNLIKPLEKALRSNDRINCNDYVSTLINEHYFHRSGKHIFGALENVIKTVPSEYVSDFIFGFTSTSHSSGTEKYIILNTDNMNDTANSLKKVEVPKIKKMVNKNVKRKNNVKHDYIKEQIRNADIGDCGEKLVFESEKNKLLKAWKEGKINSVHEHLKWVSLESDSEGYDILSYDIETEQPMFIEVKTTLGNKSTPFYMSKGELEYSKNNNDHYHLFRIYNLKNNVAEYYELKGDLSNSKVVEVNANNYLVSLK